MCKWRLLFATALISTAALNAGQIQVGGVDGLTSTYITSGGSTTGWAEKNYINNLFTTANTVTATGTNSLPLQTATGSGTGASTMTDANGIVFSMINDGPLTGVTNNVWASQTAGTQTITIPVLSVISAPTDVYVMLNDYDGYAGLNTVITFNFSGHAADVITLNDLINGTGAIRSSVECLTATGTGSPAITCPNAQTADGHTVSASDPSVVNVNHSGDATITTRAVYTATYSINPGRTTSPYDNGTYGSTGNVMLDELRFQFSTDYTGSALTSISIASPSANSASNSRLALSAITLVTATPEPGSIVLLVIGLGVLGLSAKRNRKAQVPSSN